MSTTTDYGIEIEIVRRRIFTKIKRAQILVKRKKENMLVMIFKSFQFFLLESYQVCSSMIWNFFFYEAYEF